MSCFDPMAAAIDWLDAYRAADLSIVDMYAPSAVLECGCEGKTPITGETALTEYWRRQFMEEPAGALEHLKTTGEAIMVSYEVPNGIVEAWLRFDETGLIRRSQCGPAASA